LDILVVNAGIARVGYVEEFEISDWLEVLNTNLNGAFYTVKAALPHIREGGHIVFVGSIASKRAFPGWSAYCASKWGLLGFAKSLGEELKGRIKVSTVLPGAVDTPLWEGIGGDKSKMLKAEDVAKVILNIVESDGWIREVEILPKGGII
jgi:NAD(P)-dependent dehydrogenase (short-subunit alcohol dehydrogenase family)